MTGSDSMSIYRVKKDKDNPYVMINKHSIHDQDLSFKAKGILAYLLSRPDDWQVYETEIMKHASDGRSSVRSGIKELIDNGYIERGKRRAGDGKFQGYEYNVYEVPNHVRFSDNGKSDNGKPHTSNIDSTNNDITKYIGSGEQDRPTALIAFANECADDQEVRDAIIKFDRLYQMRRYTKHPLLTSRTLSTIADSLLTVTEHYGKTIDLNLEEITQMMEAYFLTEYKEGCNYSIAHFNEPKIKEHLYYDVR